jgi:hypothetical protein
MEYRPVNIADKFVKFSEHWSLKIITQMNDCHFKLVKFHGEFVWHDHKDTDEVLRLCSWLMSARILAT